MVASYLTIASYMASYNEPAESVFVVVTYYAYNLSCNCLLLQAFGMLVRKVLEKMNSKVI